MSDAATKQCAKPGCSAPRLFRKSLCKKHNRQRRNKQLRERRLDLHKKLREYFEKHPCADCGEKDPVVLQFDHRDPADKSHTVADMVSRGRSQKAIFAEIEKCDVRCANCHARRTAKQRGYYL